MYKNPTKRLIVAVPEELHAEFKQLADIHERSMSSHTVWLIKHAVKQWRALQEIEAAPVLPEYEEVAP